MTDPTPWIQFGALAVTVLAFALAFVLPRLLRRRRQHAASAPEASPAAVTAPTEDEPDACLYCDAPAERAPSRILGAVGWLAVLRVRFGLAPAYEARVDERLKPSLCEKHGRAWDARIRLANLRRQLRAAQTDVEAADQLAVYEAEGIDAELAASLTEAQRKVYDARKRKRG